MAFNSVAFNSVAFRHMTFNDLTMFGGIFSECYKTVGLVSPEAHQVPRL